MAVRSNAAGSQFWHDGLAVVPRFLVPAEVAVVLEAIYAYRRDHQLPIVARPQPGRFLRYQVIDGHHFVEAVPDPTDIVARVHAEVDRICGPPLTLIDDVRAACNVNITPPEGQYPWHYDRNQVTALVYLNRVQGGETEFHRNYRLVAPEGTPQLQSVFDSVLRSRAARALRGHPQTVTPDAGTLVVLRGDRTLHSVRPVAGDDDRINLVIAFDRPDTHHHRAALDHFLYDAAPNRPPDPAATRGPG